MSAFIEGLFGNKNAVKPENVPKNDTLLRVRKKCLFKKFLNTFLFLN